MQFLCCVEESLESIDEDVHEQGLAFQGEVTQDQMQIVSGVLHASSRPASSGRLAIIDTPTAAVMCAQSQEDMAQTLKENVDKALKDEQQSRKEEEARKRKAEQVKKREEAALHKKNDPVEKTRAWLHGVNKDLSKVMALEKEAESASLDGLLEKEYSKRFQMYSMKLVNFRDIFMKSIVDNAFDPNVYKEAQATIESLKKDMTAWQRLRDCYAKAPKAKAKSKEKAT
jgi:hypothetical protein